VLSRQSLHSLQVLIKRPDEPIGSSQKRPESSAGQEEIRLRRRNSMKQPSAARHRPKLLHPDLGNDIEANDS